MVYLTAIRFGMREQVEYSTMKAAAKAACIDIDSNEACPVNIIEKDGFIIWVNKGSFDDSYEKLRVLAGIEDNLSTI